MSHQRSGSHGESLRGPHSVSLKVLRLSRPTLTPHHPLPDPPTLSALGISPSAALGYPTADAPPDAFVLTPLLSLPEAFGSAYVGETFACTLCANCEARGADDVGSPGAGGGTRAVVSGVRVAAEMVTPSSGGRGVELRLHGEDEELERGGEEKKQREEREGKGEESGGASGGKLLLRPGESLQKILRFELKEEGNHTLAVTVTYTETQLVGSEEGQQQPAQGQAGRAASGRVRTFRKLYQFTAQQLLSVRTKTGSLAPLRKAQSARQSRYAIEAQLENMGEGPLSLESVWVSAKSPFEATSLNWDLPLESELKQTAPPVNAPILNPRDIIQVAFVLEQRGNKPVQRDDDDDDDTDDGGSGDAREADKPVVLGQLSISWRSAMGEKGSLSTSWLTCRRRAVDLAAAPQAQPRMVKAGGR